MLLQTLAAEKKQMVLVHANYMIGIEMKISALKHRGFWLANNGGTCLEFNLKV